MLDRGAGGSLRGGRAGRGVPSPRVHDERREDVPLRERPPVDRDEDEERPPVDRDEDDERDVDRDEEARFELLLRERDEEDRLELLLRRRDRVWARCSRGISARTTSLTRR